MLGQRLLSLVQGRTDDPVTAAGRRRLDPLGAAPGEQFLPDTIGPPLNPADARGELGGVVGAHSRKPRWRRTCARWYSAVRPDHS